MVPRGSVLRRLEAVCEVLARCDGTLGDAIDTVHIHRLVLSYSVPVDTSAIVTHAVYHGDVEGLLNSELETRVI